MGYTPADKEGRSSVGIIFKEIAENSSIHGIPKVISSKHFYQKILWLLLVTGTCGFMIYQLQELFKTYYSYPIKTTVSLKFGVLPFPAISFCNMNPVKFSSARDTSPNVKDLLLNTKTENHRNKQHVKKRSVNTSSVENTMITTPPPNTMITTSPPKAMTTSTRPNLLTISGTTNPQSDSKSTPTNLVTISETTPSSIPKAGKTTTPPSLSTPRKTMYTSKPRANHTLFVKSNSTSSYFKRNSDFQDYMKREEQGLKDKWQERIAEFKTAFQNESRRTRFNVGHQIKDMLISCVFNGKTCFAENFTSFQSLDYGNCYTLQHSTFQSRKTGPLQGLRMTLNLEKKEYVQDFLDAYGIRLVIHEPGSFSFPMEEGVTLSSGYETTIGMRMINVNRIGKPHGDCENGNEFEKIFGIRYTMQSCIQLCKHGHVVRKCGCQPSESLVDTGKEGLFNTLPVCALEYESDICEKYIDFKFESGMIDCDCRSPCSQTVYEKSLSGRIWPNDEFLKYGLLQELCSKNLSYSSSDCDKFRANKKSYNPSNYRDNFLKVLIYYEDLNYEVIKEEPMYDGFQFVSDIGGALGLFMGASILSFVEVIHVFVEILIVIRRRVTMRGNKVVNIYNKKTLK